MIVFLIILLVLFFIFQAFVLFCCLAAGNDSLSQEISDREQMEFLAEWEKNHPRHTSR